VLVVVGGPGCDADSEDRAAGADGPSAAHSSEEPMAQRQRPSPDRVISPQSASAEGDSPYRVISAFVPDHAFARADRVDARRLIYRVTLMVPPMLGDRRHTFGRPSAELVVDVSETRLRARFEGVGWPVAEGSEVRIRRDQPGVYVFGADGGRPLGPGQMAAWFEGGRVRRYPGVHLRSPPAEEQVGPGALVCRLLAEWANHPTDTLSRRCGDGGSPVAYRMGPWRADRTADVAVQLQGNALRADHLDAPDRPGHPAAPILEPHLAARVSPLFTWPDAEPGPHALVVHNRGRARALVVVGGAPVGWVDPGASATFEGWTAGVFQVGALRPLGAPAQRAQRVRIPGELTLSH
jgi:hypothetical protein